MVTAPVALVSCVVVVTGSGVVVLRGVMVSVTGWSSIGFVVEVLLTWHVLVITAFGRSYVVCTGLVWLIVAKSLIVRCNGTV